MKPNALVTLVLLFLSLLVGISWGSTEECIGTAWTKHERFVNNTYSRVYIVPRSDRATPTSMRCLLTELTTKVAPSLPKAVVAGFVSSDFRQAFLIKIDFNADLLIIVEAHIRPEEYTGMGTFTTYPKAVKRLTEIIAGTPLPKVFDLSPELQKKVIANNVYVSVFQIKAIVGTNID